ncbi:MAG: DUF3467 domain-containing protein [Anaerolineales bacterium]|nr:DUF3467 domain-containing protein [Anaerolineales bacterium]
MVKTDPEKKGQKITIPPDLEVVYSNLVRITHSPSELVFDFAQMLPGLTGPAFKSRVLVSPLTAKLIYKALGDNLVKYEANFGEIPIPGNSSLADSLFQPPEE